MAKLLIAEDHPDLRALLSLQLANRGFSCVGVANGKEVLDQLESQGTEAIDLILMDMNMPELDGWQTTSQIRDSQHRALPIIAVTAYSLEGDRARALNAGCNAFFCKPIDLDAIVLEIVNLISKRCKDQT